MEDPSQKKFDEEMRKVKALNKLNVEIYTRLGEGKVSCNACRQLISAPADGVGHCQHCGTNSRFCACDVPQAAAQPQQLTFGFGMPVPPTTPLVQCARCRKSMPSWITTSVSYVQLSGTQLLVKVEQRAIPKPNFYSQFESINFFNDPLPILGYRCMERVIEKYEMLHPQKALSLIEKWKKALEEIHVILGELESQHQNSSEKIDVVLELCLMDSSQSTAQLSQTAVLVGRINRQIVAHQAMPQQYVRHLTPKVQPSIGGHCLQFCLQFPQQESLLPEMMKIVNELYK
jgi:hypothetical protein